MKTLVFKGTVEFSMVVHLPDGYDIQGLNAKLAKQEVEKEFKQSIIDTLGHDRCTDNETQKTKVTVVQNEIL